MQKHYKFSSSYIFLLYTAILLRENIQQRLKALEAAYIRCPSINCSHSSMDCSFISDTNVTPQGLQVIICEKLVHSLQ